MIFFKRDLDENGSYAKYYFQEPTGEIDSQRIYPTMVVCPGGAYFWTSIREDEQVALRFLAEGFHVVVVHYATEGRETMSVPNDSNLPKQPISSFPNPLVALAKAVAYLRENKVKYAVDESFIIVSGYSAGGNLAGQLGTLWHTDWLEDLVGLSRELYRPTHLLLAYAAYDVASGQVSQGVDRVALAATGSREPSQKQLDQVNPIKNVSQQTPPSFIWHTLEDALVPASGALEFCQALGRYHIPYELHVFNKGKHGLVLGDLRTGIKASNQNAQVYQWVELFLEWIYPRKTDKGGFYNPIDG